ncbi:MAG: PASTA domain-containing protein, partial [Muribaculaceae bacterium]|nr:PASTA domain-containing protein [Muribaculaceae bacterium]
SYVRPRACSSETAAKMRYMLKRVVWGDHGTARLLRDNNVAVAGKTGTCWTIDPVTHKYNPGEKRLAFCGFFPADSPKYSCIVLIEKPRQNAFGAASTSGTVLKNIACKMYSRGMLDNMSDYRESTSPHTQPVLYATTDSVARRAVTNGLGIRRAQALRTPTPSQSGLVPDVLGLGMREAVAALEHHGYNVAFTGAGYVQGQMPPAHTPLPRGQKVTLSLHE